MTPTVRILLVDDHTIFRESLIRLLAREPGLQVVGHCATVSSATGKARSSGKTRDLTERQRIVLRGILDGLTNKEIAARLQTSEAAIKANIQELFSKAGVRTRSHLVRVAIERFSSDWLLEKH